MSYKHLQIWLPSFGLKCFAYQTFRTNTKGDISLLKSATRGALALRG